MAALSVLCFQRMGIYIYGGACLGVSCFFKNLTACFEYCIFKGSHLLSGSERKRLHHVHMPTVTPRNIYANEIAKLMQGGGNNCEAVLVKLLYTS